MLICFAPYDDPEIALAIVAERGGTGSELGAIAADIFRAYFNIEPEQEVPPPDAPLDDTPESIPEATPAE